MNCSVGETGATQRGNVILAYRCRGLSEFKRECDQFVLAITKWSGERIALDCGNQFVVFRQCTESLPVMLDSIVALVNNRYGDRNCFTFSSR